MFLLLSLLLRKGGMQSSALKIFLFTASEQMDHDGRRTQCDVSWRCIFYHSRIYFSQVLSYMHDPNFVGQIPCTCKKSKDQNNIQAFVDSIKLDVSPSQ